MGFMSALTRSSSILKMEKTIQEFKIHPIVVLQFPGLTTKKDRRLVEISRECWVQLKSTEILLQRIELQKVDLQQMEDEILRFMNQETSENTQTDMKLRIPRPPKVPITFNASSSQYDMQTPETLYVFGLPC